MTFCVQKKIYHVFRRSVKLIILITEAESDQNAEIGCADC